MKPTDTVRLTRLLSAAYPAMRLDEYTTDAWQMLLADLDADDVMSAVLALGKSSPRFIAPADIRREIAATHGLLPPSEAEGFTAAAHVASNQGEGGRNLHPVVRAAYYDLGGPGAFFGDQSFLRNHWRRAYEARVAEYERALLAGDLGREVEAVKRMALAAGRAS